MERNIVLPSEGAGNKESVRRAGAVAVLALCILASSNCLGRTERNAALVKPAPVRVAESSGKLEPAATSKTPQQPISRGAPADPTTALSTNELVALRTRLRDCWHVPADVRSVGDLAVTVLIQFNKDGSLASEPTVLNDSPHPMFKAAAQSAVGAIRACAPFGFLPAAKYDDCKAVEVRFDPRDLSDR